MGGGLGRADEAGFASLTLDFESRELSSALSGVYLDFLIVADRCDSNLVSSLVLVI